MVTHKNDTYAWENTQISFLKQNWKYICINYFKYLPSVYVHAFIDIYFYSYTCVCVYMQLLLFQEENKKHLSNYKEEK